MTAIHGGESSASGSLATFLRSGFSNAACLPSIGVMDHANDYDDDLDAPDDWPIQRRIVPAEQTELSPVANLTCVWDMAHEPLMLRGRFTQAARPRHYRIERGNGVTRCRKVDEQDTEAYREREIQRRARQVVPRPSASLRTRSAKLLALLAGT